MKRIIIKNTRSIPSSITSRFITLKYFARLIKITFDHVLTTILENGILQATPQVQSWEGEYLLHTNETDEIIPTLSDII